MGRIVFSVSVTAAEWNLDGNTFEYFLTITGQNVSLEITAPEDYAGVYETTVTALSTGPVNIIKPEPKGPISVGYDLTMFDGVWLSLDTSPLTFSRRFLNEGVQVGTGTSYTTQATDAGDTITVGVTATDSNGSSAEAVSTATIEMRATPWVQPDNVFNGSKRLDIPLTDPITKLFQIVGETVDENSSANLYLMFVSGTVDVVTGTQQFFSHSNAVGGLVLSTTPDIRSTANGAGLSETAIEEGPYGSVIRRSNTAPVATERFSAIMIGRPFPEKPGNVQFVQTALFEGAGSWDSSATETIAGETIWTAGEQGITIGARSDGSRAVTGTISRVAVWCNGNLPFDLYEYSGTTPTFSTEFLEKFMLNSTTLTPPDVAQAAYGTPVLDFNTDTHFNEGSHEGSLPSFVVTT